MDPQTGCLLSDAVVFFNVCAGFYVYDLWLSMNIYLPHPSTITTRISTFSIEDPY